MLTRQIVRDPNVAFGRWRFEDTAIFLDDLRRDAQVDAQAAGRAYRSLGLTDAEFAAALEFVFPEIAEARAYVDSPHIHVHCACGIVRTVLRDPVTMETDTCPCGRKWKVTISLAAVTGTKDDADGSAP
jgi:hypothetical protein